MSRQEQAEARESTGPDYREMWIRHRLDLDAEAGRGLQVAAELHRRGDWPELTDTLAQLRVLTANIAHMDQVERHARLLPG